MKQLENKMAFITGRATRFLARSIKSPAGLAAFISLCVMAPQKTVTGQLTPAHPVVLSDAHRAAINQPRRIIMQYDINCEGMPFGMRSGSVGPDLRQEAVEFHMAALREKGNQIDSVWWELGEGEVAQWPSEVLQTQQTVFPPWWDAGLDPVELLVEATQEMSREVFWSYRINGSPWPRQPLESQTFKTDHPEWAHQGLPQIPTSLFWDFSFPAVREHKVRILKEVAQKYNFDGISLDFARVPVLFRAGQQWIQRDSLTDLIRQVRQMLLEVGADRGRPYLLAVRIPENLPGCHFDGIDIETWVREQLVDILVLGCRSSEVDINAFRRLCKGRNIKLYPSFDDHHSSDGYHEAPPEVWRGVCANWWSQGADGMHTFNLVFSPREAREAIGAPKVSFSRHVDAGWKRQCEIFRNIGSPASLQGQDKVFYVQRRGGGHGPTVVPNAEDWSTPRHMYFNTNMFGSLPAALDNAGRVDTLLMLHVGDDVHQPSRPVQNISLRMILSDPAAESLPENARLDQLVVANQGRPGLPGYAYRNSPPARGIEQLIEVRINNSLLGGATIDGGNVVVMQAGEPVQQGMGWLAFDVAPNQLAKGKNLVGVRVTSRPAGVRDKIMIERLELHVDYD